MKVRLKPCRTPKVATLAHRFQFHEGPIKTGGEGGRPLSARLFQFHEGPIKTIIRCHAKIPSVVSIP